MIRFDLINGSLNLTCSITLREYDEPSWMWRKFQGCIVGSWFLIYQKPTTYLCQQHRGAIYFLSGMDLVSFTNPLALDFQVRGVQMDWDWVKNTLRFILGWYWWCWFITVMNCPQHHQRDIIEIMVFIEIIFTVTDLRVVAASALKRRSSRR